MISILKHFKRVNYKITDVLHAKLRLLYIHQGLHKSILHNHVNFIMLKLNIYISLTKWSPKLMISLDI
jgi:hypothetical protein